ETLMTRLPKARRLLKSHLVQLGVAAVLLLAGRAQVTAQNSHGTSSTVKIEGMVCLTTRTKTKNQEPPCEHKRDILVLGYDYECLQLNRSISQGKKILPYSNGRTNADG